jgi:hypothetical protein
MCLSENGNVHFFREKFLLFTPETLNHSAALVCWHLSHHTPPFYFLSIFCFSRMIRRPLLILAITVFLGASVAADSCQDFTVGKFGPDSIDNPNYCSGACMAAGDTKGAFVENSNGSYKCDCLDEEGTVTRTLCEELSGERGSVAASTTESGAVSKNVSIAFLFAFAGWKLFG